MSEPAPPWARHLEPGSDPSSIDLLAAGTLPRAWVAHWRSLPDRVVLADRSRRRWRGSELLERTELVARRLRGAGIEPGARVVLAGPTSIAYVVAHVALLRAGLVVVPVNPASTRGELESIMRASQPRVAIIADDTMRQWAAEIDPGVLTTSEEVGIDDGPPTPLDVAGPDDPALLPCTSGTTGVPKGVPLTHGNLLASAEGLRIAWRWRPSDRLVLCLPLFHMHGMGVGLHGTLLTGASAVLHDRFDPDEVLDAATEATMFFGVPTMYARLAGAAGLDRLGNLRLCVSGSAPLSAELHQRIADRSGQVVLERYGMTETVMLTSNPHDGERRPGTVGFPLPGVDLRLNPDTDEIEVRGPNVFAGYLDQPDANAVAFTADGWFRTGDVGSFDTDGYLRIIGRSKELIISGGYNVYPREVEDVIRSHPAVVDAAVAGTPSPEWGEVVTAFVELGSEVDDAELLAWIAERVSPYKRPRIVHRLDALPRNPLGKVVRAELRPPG